MTLLQKFLAPLFDAADAGSGSGAGASADGQSGTPAAQNNSGTPAPQGQAAPQGAAAPTAQPTGFTYTEDRSKWIPPHRFNEVNEKARRASELEAQLAERDRKIAALAGVTPADPNSEKAKQIDAAFRAQYPHLVPLLDLSKEQIEALTRTPQALDRTSQIEAREWARHGKAQMASLYTQVADAIGADDLNDDQKGDLRESFSSWFKSRCISEARAQGLESPEDSPTFKRYEDGDPKLLEEFTQRYTSTWVDPVRRRLTQQTVTTRTRPVPNSGGRQQVTQTQRPEKFNSLDERLDYAAKLYKERGGAFDR